jgi:hypothetical protein
VSDEQPVVNEHATPVAFFRLPEYVEAFGRSLAEAMNGLARSKDPILAKTPRVRTHRMYRGRNSLESSAASETIDPPIMATRTDYSLSHDLIASGDTDGLLAEIDAVAERYVSQVMPQFFENLSMVTTAFGNTHDAGGQPFNWDMFLDMFEGMDVPFDEDDNPVLPALYAGIGFTMPPEMTPEQTQRLEEIIARKRDAHLAGQRYRRIPRDPLGG